MLSEASRFLTREAVRVEWGSGKWAGETLVGAAADSKTRLAVGVAFPDYLIHWDYLAALVCLTV